MPASLSSKPVRGWLSRIAGRHRSRSPFPSCVPPNRHTCGAHRSTDPVPVLLNPSTVEIWEVPKAGGAFADSRTSPPLTTGKAYNEIPPDTHLKPIRTSIRDYLATVRELGAAGLAQGAAGLSPEDRAQALIDLLAAVGDDEAEQAALNEVLEGLGSSARVVQSRGLDNSAD